MPLRYFVYIVECADQTLYIGSTNNIEKRLHAHNHLKSGAHYTKIRRPVKLVYFEKCKSVGEARSREYMIKQSTRDEKLKLIHGK